MDVSHGIARLVVLSAGLSPLYGGHLLAFQEMAEHLQDVSRMIPERAAERNLVSREWARLLSAAHPWSIGRTADQFVGFLRGRLRISPPNWWRNILATGDLHNQKIGFGFNRALGVARRKWRTRGGYAFNGCKSVTFGPKSLVVLSEDGTAIPIMREVFASFEERGGSWTEEEVGGIAVKVTSSHLFIILGCPWQDLGCGEELYCIDLGTQKCSWTVELADGLPWGSLSGDYTGSYTEIRANRNLLSVWTAHDLSICFQAFEVNDGRLVYQFCTLPDEERKRPSGNIEN